MPCMHPPPLPLYIFGYLLQIPLKHPNPNSNSIVQFIEFTYTNGMSSKE
jgi:hypothetical protein